MLLLLPLLLFVRLLLLLLLFLLLLLVLVPAFLLLLLLLLLLFLLLLLQQELLHPPESICCGFMLKPACNNKAKVFKRVIYINGQTMKRNPPSKPQTDSSNLLRTCPYTWHLQVPTQLQQTI